MDLICEINMHIVLIQKMKTFVPGEPLVKEALLSQVMR